MISRKSQKRLKLVLDLDAEKAYSRVLGQEFDLLVSSVGHFLLPLDRFAPQPKQPQKSMAFISESAEAPTLLVKQHEVADTCTTKDNDFILKSPDPESTNTKDNDVILTPTIKEKPQICLLT